MRTFRLKSGLRRSIIGDYALPLGLVPGERVDDALPPIEGYTLDYTPAEEEEPDAYSFHIVVSFERVGLILERMLSLMPRNVHAILEIGSRDAYRAVDVYLGHAPIERRAFADIFSEYAGFLLEDGSIAIGAMSEEPFIEVFLDQWKGISVHVPLTMRDDVERELQSFGLEEVPATWPEMDDNDALEALRPRSILALDDEFSPDIDEILLQLRQGWRLELNVDPDGNIDDGGRALGRTLWHGLLIVEDVDVRDAGAYLSVWATAGSLQEVERLIDSAIAELPQYRFSDIYTLDRVAFDERPDELVDLAPTRRPSGVHLVDIDAWPIAPNVHRSDEAEWA